ncbi:eukaryotic translation elongation factor 1 epsilon-1-like [Ptychodera flava]|uniref:eukaryotic translation elongation factor 1 epsilon-1-like n=1 Tax=Ptychodera flava TaxID=63121 RepID=UPI00396A4E34
MKTINEQTNAFIMADMKQDVRAIAKFLGVNSVKVNVNSETKIPVVHTENGSSVSGLASITKYLAQKANKQTLLGTSAEQKAAISQWLEYRVTQVDRCHNREDVKTVLKELNFYLRDRVYMSGNQFTIADLLLYYGLHSIVSQLTMQERQKFMNLSRWFDNVQRYPSIQQHLTQLVFPKNILYADGVH